MGRHAPPRGAPARLACLVLLALVAAVCLFVTVSAAPAACPVTANGTACVGCAKKSCKFDDNCHFNTAGQARRGICQDLSDGVVAGPTDRCSGVQRRHGKNAPASVGGPGKKKIRCNAKSVERPGFSAVDCECVNNKGNNLNNKGNPVKKCKRCQQSAPLTVPAPPPPPAPNGTPSPPPPPGNISSPPPPPPGTDSSFLPNNLMTMQGGAVKYTPSNANGDWKALCQIPAQAMAVDYGASLTPAGSTTAQADAAWLALLWTGNLNARDAPPGLSTTMNNTKTQYDTNLLNVPLFMSGTTYFDAAADWYKNGLPTDAAGKSTGGLAPATYVGNGKNFLDSYFRSGLQTSGPGTKAPSGSESNSANAQILKKTSAYWVATTHVQYNLDKAEANIAAGKTAEAKANMDSAAAAYYGCGDTNPVPLPKYEGTQITYPTTPGSTDTGSNATTMSIYGVANKRAVNYKTAVSVPGTASTTSPGTTKAVAQLNIDAAAAFNTATPTLATVQAVRDVTNTIFLQAAQRYIAKITLAAQMPGNGMGGSTKASQAITTPATNPTKGYWGAGWGIWTAADKQQATACGGSTTQVPPAPTAPTGTTPNVVVGPGGQMNGGLACSKMTSGAGSTVSNTATFETVQPAVSQTGSGDGTTGANPSPAATAAATACPTVSGALAAPNCLPNAAAKEPYTVSLTGTGGVAYAAGVATSNGGLTEDGLLKATRGIPQSGAAPAGGKLTKATPTACIGPDVFFNEVRNSGVNDGVTAAAAAISAAGFAVALCDPNGCIPGQLCAGAPAGGVVGSITGPATTAGLPPAPTATATYATNLEYYSGVAGAGCAAAAAGCKPGVKAGIQKFWDPVTAAQASGGARCCAALYYGSDGLGLGGATGVTGIQKNSAFEPNPLVGGAMDSQTVPGGMCSDGSPTTTVKQGLSKALNVKEKEYLEGQAFFASVAPSMYVLPKVNSVQATQTANANKQKKCAQTLTSMLKMNQEAKGTSVDSTICKGDGRVVASTTSGTASAPGMCTGTGYSAVKNPLWLVKIGDTSPAEYAVPNAYCYANACLEDFAAVGTATAFKGKDKLSTLQSSPDMASNPSTTTNACGRANAACAAAPSTWNGGEAIFTKCTKTNAGQQVDCTAAELKGQLGMLPSA